MQKRRLSTADLPDLWHQSTDDEKDAVLFLKELELSGVPVTVTKNATVVLGERPKTETAILSRWTAHNYQLGIRQAGLSRWMLFIQNRERFYKTWRGVQNAIRRWMDDTKKFHRIAMRDWSWYGRDVEVSDR